jgi:hypothetical protein
MFPAAAAAAAAKAKNSEIPRCHWLIGKGFEFKSGQT